jgi:hypothetical protein
VEEADNDEEAMVINICARGGAAKDPLYGRRPYGNHQYFSLVFSFRLRSLPLSLLKLRKCLDPSETGTSSARWWPEMGIHILDICHDELTGQLPFPKLWR